MQEPFWTRLEALVKPPEVVIDRPKGSSHPRYPAIAYPLDYGYLTGTSGGDGNEMGVWRGSLPEGRLDAVVCTVDDLKRDAEVKLMIGCSSVDKRLVLRFDNTECMSATLVERETT